MAKKKKLTKAERKKARFRQRRMEREAKERERLAELCMRTAMVVLLLSLDIQMAAHRMV